MADPIRGDRLPDRLLLLREGRATVPKNRKRVRAVQSDGRRRRDQIGSTSCGSLPASV